MASARSVKSWSAWRFGLLFRWFVGLGIDDAAWDQTTLGKNCDRLLGGDVEFLAAVLA